ncbi:MAG: DUF4351 domain-containing protein [Minicystis sp.]
MRHRTDAALGASTYRSCALPLQCAIVNVVASMAHEILVDLFKTRPSLAPEILVEALGIALPSYTEARLASVDLTQVQPAEYRADVVVLLLDSDVPVLVLIIEVQLGVDPRKRFSWPAYAMVSRGNHGCPVGLLVVAPDPDVAAWCAEPIETGIPGFVLRPPVLRREAVPVVTDPAEAARRLELAMLSVMAHGQTAQGETIAGALLPAIAGLDEERSRFYLDLLLNCVGEATRRALEAKMKGYEYQSEFAKKYVAQGERAMLLRQLRTRFGELPAAVVARVESAEVAMLERWGDRVLSAKTLAEVLDEPS